MKQKGVRDPAVGVRHRETTQDERMRVISLRENARWSWRQIERELRIDPRTASRIYHRYNQHSTPSNRKRTGRPLIFDDEEKAHLVAFITPYSTSELGGNLHRDRRRLLSEDCAKCDDFTGISQT